MFKPEKCNINYILTIEAPSVHLLKVEVTFEDINADDDFFDLIMPVWRPGRYFIFDFSGGVQEFSASGENGESLMWHKTDKTTWRIQHTGKKITAKYKVYANEISQRTRGLDNEHAFINGTAVFMYCEKYRKYPLTLKVIPYDSWHVTTGLDNPGGDLNEFAALDYDYLVDCPLEIGNQEDFDFDVDGKKHIVSFFGAAKFDRETLINDFIKIIKLNYKFWGNIPYEKYVFIVHCTPQSGGGTEHINSTVVGVRPAAFETEGGYTGFLRLISHEFFHTWNVKQLKPAGLTPYNYTKENYTSELWIAEGCTSYYDGLFILRTGQLKLEKFFMEITRGIEDERKRPGNKIQPVSESSFDAWVKFWKRTENAYLSESDYYGKGSYVCNILDLEIRNASLNRHSLDDVMKAMYERFPLDKKGYTNEDFRKVCEEFAGESLQQFFDDYVYGTKPIEWEKYLSFAGLELKSDKNTPIPVIGLRTVQQGDKIIVNETIAGSSAEKAGMIMGDEIIALNGTRLTYTETEEMIKELKQGESIKVTVFRKNTIKDFTLTLREQKLADYSLEKISSPSKLQKSIYESWLNNKW